MRLPAAILLVLLLLAAPAGAATVELVKTGELPGTEEFRGNPGLPPTDVLTFRVVADAGDADDLRIDGLRVTGTTPLRAGERCRADAPGSVVCDPGGTAARPAQIAAGAVELGDGDDRLHVGATPVTLAVTGGDGDDTLDAAGGSPSTWDGGPGADRIVFGAGWTLLYSDRTEGVDVSLDGVANDGAPGEGDDAGSQAVAIAGGSGADRLRSGERPARLVGGEGDDVLEAGGTQTTVRYHGGLLDHRETNGELLGGPGDDRLLGSAVADRLAGGEGNDEIHGGDGPDAMSGDDGADRLHGDAGNDGFELDVVGDGDPDTTSGGDGLDLATWNDAGSPRRARLAVDLADGRGPDGVAGEGDALAADVENVHAVVAAFAVTGSAGPNVLRLEGDGAVSAGAGDDVVWPTAAPGGDVRADLGAGRDRVLTGSGARVEARDGEPDRIDCIGLPRDVRADAGLDRTARCTTAASVNFGYTHFAGRRAPGRRVGFTVACGDEVRACRVRLRPRLGRRRLPPLTVDVPRGGRRRAWVRVPRDAAPGRRVIRFAIVSESPFEGVPDRTSRGLIVVRVVRRR